ncbi:hypothetical protein D3OALGA1CA_1969 [Olavius algarvensis associated proteobacterium Delta 3]|nr:hypothetical protein D3OALGA1CA_1969 [Olavius algarvensis associated proteobacterium Delta 3]CAB5119003.1 hypothetical protein D3OALGB2SA_2862 [Olavius algarvensis associated proteobacterium Delta 3]
MPITYPENCMKSFQRLAKKKQIRYVIVNTSMLARMQFAMFNILKTD